MFTSAKIHSGSTYLVSHLSANDYYAKGERVTGEWVGEGAGSLGLSGEVRPEDFEALRVDLRPGTGERLTPRTKDTRQPTLAEAAGAFREKEGRSGTAQEVANFRLTLRPVSNRVAFLDFQCSAQKSVSILAVLGGDKRLRIAHERAARVALSELERFASRQNNTPFKRQSAVTGNICAAAFTHDASRALDPQLHTHFVIANATRDQTGKWYALNEYEMVRAVRYAGKVYQNEMARAVVELGYAIRQVRKNGEITGFEIEGVFDSLCERFSKRRGEIERQIEKFEEKQGRKPTVKEIALITRETRPAELKEIATAEVLALQRSQLSPRGMDAVAGPSCQVGATDSADANWSGTGCPSRECRAFIRTAKRSAGA
jgi:conjugative relaxase-like TrwC/TraI family protein